jgi:hypothetical protein
VHTHRPRFDAESAVRKGILDLAEHVGISKVASMHMVEGQMIMNQLRDLVSATFTDLRSGWQTP